MSKVISFAMFCLGVTFFCVLFVSSLNFTATMQKMNDYHYATVHEIESSDFAGTVIAERKNNSTYSTTITQKSIKEDMPIYEVTTSTNISIPILNYEVTYVKSSVAR